MYVGLEVPSWAGAMMVLTNVVANKKEYCAEYDIEINEEYWVLLSFTRNFISG
ncbi:hypothetical protein SOM37_24745 [Bacillus thuringiensis]|uniref:hypothetical protein n=1 Tax=Bacillus thuringiensis TaxID=1428 RepID=UPI002A6B56B9|nr:hypothetical protein [Bacillus thuringiensis]MDY0952051.1 hypothetical protein [Bacillus thuringiensis]